MIRTLKNNNIFKMFLTHQFIQFQYFIQNYRNAKLSNYHFERK